MDLVAHIKDRLGHLWEDGMAVKVVIINRAGCEVGVGRCEDPVEEAIQDAEYTATQPTREEIEAEMRADYELEARGSCRRYGQ